MCTVTYAFDVLIKSFKEMSSRLLVACDEMRKRHFIVTNNVKASKKNIKKQIVTLTSGRR